MLGGGNRHNRRGTLGERSAAEISGAMLSHDEVDNGPRGGNDAAVQVRHYSGTSVLSADFHAASLTLVSGELVAESSVAPPGDGDGGEFGLAEHG